MNAMVGLTVNDTRTGAGLETLLGPAKCRVTRGDESVVLEPGPREPGGRKASTVNEPAPSLPASKSNEASEHAYNPRKRERVLGYLREVWDRPHYALEDYIEQEIPERE